MAVTIYLGDLRAWASGLSVEMRIRDDTEKMPGGRDLEDSQQLGTRQEKIWRWKIHQSRAERRHATMAAAGRQEWRLPIIVATGFYLVELRKGIV
jgi:hypothetical protein